MFSKLDLQLTDNSLQEPKSDVIYGSEANACNDGKDSKVLMLVKHEDEIELFEIEDFVNYVWQDEDYIQICYEQCVLSTTKTSFSAR